MHKTLFLFVILLVASPVLGVIEYTIQEEAALDTYIGNVSADTGLKDVVGENEFNSLRYSILSGASPQTAALFKIGTTTGILTVGGRVDRENLCPYVQAACKLGLEIAAQYESLLRKYNVEVTVTDINDNSPTFPKANMNLRLSEATALDLSVSIDAAADLDGTANFSVQRYAVDPPSVPFSVKFETNLAGVQQLSLVVTRQLDRETKDQYNFKILAYDGDVPTPRSGSVSVSVEVEVRF
jgi:hypothetical protein